MNEDVLYHLRILGLVIVVFVAFWAMGVYINQIMNSPPEIVNILEVIRK